MPIVYAGKSKVEGRKVIHLELTTWCGWTQKHTTTKLWADERQDESVRRRGLHAFEESGKRYTISPSVAGFGDLFSKKRFSLIRNTAGDE